MMHGSSTDQGGNGLGSILAPEKDNNISHLLRSRQVANLPARSPIIITRDDGWRARL